MPRPGSDHAPRPALWVPLALGTLIAGYVALYGGLSLLKHRYYLYNDFDLALFVQALERLLHGSTFLSIRGMHWLGDHASYVLFPLAPLYAVARHPATLLVFQTVVLALGAIPVHRLARRALATGPDHADGAARAVASLAFTAAYLLQPALGYLNLFEFHPETVATTTLLFAIEAVVSGRWRACLVWSAIAMTAREDVALVVAMLGLWTALIRRPRAPWSGAALVAAAIASLAVTLLVVRPRFASEGAQYLLMYRTWGDTPAEMLVGAVRDPLRVIHALVATPGDPLDTQLKRELFVHLLLPLAFLPLLGALSLIVALPVLLEHLLSGRGQQHTIVFQYTALLLPVLAWSASEGLRRLGGWRPDVARRAAVAALACALGSQVLFGPLGLGFLQTRRPIQSTVPTDEDRVLAPVRDRMLARLPAEGDVVAGFEFLSRLADRADVHSLHHLLAGVYTYSTRPYPEPRRVSAILADWSHPRLFPYAARPDAGRRIARLIERDHLLPVEAVGDIVRWAPEREGLALVSARPDLASVPHGPRARFDGALELLASTVAPRPEPGGRTVRLATTWRRTGPIVDVYLMRIEVVDDAARIVRAHAHVLGYVVWPVADWPERVPILEVYRLVLDRALRPGRYVVRARLDRLGERGTTPTRLESSGPSAADGTFELGAFAVGAGGR